MNPRVAGFPGAVTAILRTLHPRECGVDSSGFH